MLHFPGKEKSTDFKKALQRRIANKDFNFRGAWFPDDPGFDDFEFDAPANFSEAVFSAGANFGFATFSDFTDFGRAKFNGVANFEEARFNGHVMFYGATIGDHLQFAGKLRSAFSYTATLDLQFVRIEKPEHISFHTVTLRPHWFVNAEDVDKFKFINVEWRWRSTRKEIATLRGIPLPHRMLAIACRHLAVNAEENHRYEEASRFRYMAMDARRLEHWWGFDFRRLSWWYWLASGYGERILRAAVVLLGILIICAALYTKVGFARWEPRLASESDVAIAKRDEVGAPLKLTRALTYSAAVMTFQRPEPKPATTAAQTVVLLETILGPVQAALLALAIRRKFMR